MRRLVTVAATDDYGKPRPAVIVQTDAFPENHASVVVCQLTSALVEAPNSRVTIDPNENGLQVRSQVMADKPVTIRRERIGQKIVRQDMPRQSAALGFVLGLAIPLYLWTLPCLAELRRPRGRRDRPEIVTCHADSLEGIAGLRPPVATAASRVIDDAV